MAPTAPIDINWATCRGISIREVAFGCGFNLSPVNLNTVEGQYVNLATKRIGQAILEQLDETWASYSDRKLTYISQGVYIISFSDNICVDYQNGQSPVIYIGKGWIRSRITQHLRRWIAHISQSLQDMQMDISMAEITARRPAVTCAEVESDLLEKFKERYGCYPLLNKRRGIERDNCHTYSRRSLQPLNGKKTMQRGWAIRPMSGNPWATPLN
jgi:hypothetical protein